MSKLLTCLLAVLCLMASTRTAAAQDAREDMLKAGAERIVFAERHRGRDPHYYSNFGYSCLNPDEWVHGEDGGRLCVLDVRSGHVDVLLEDPGGAVRDPVPDWDGRSIVFSYRKGGTHRYHLYRMDVRWAADGTTVGEDLVQLTDGPYDDIEPCITPDGGIVFASTRCLRWVACWFVESATLHRCEADGSNIRRLSTNTVTENTPAVLPDGRILYTRWEYVNRHNTAVHQLWTMNPDGTMQQAYIGNGPPWLGGRGRLRVIVDARPLPGESQRVVAINCDHVANEHRGPVVVLDRTMGPDTLKALDAVPYEGETRWTKVRRAPYRDPWPLRDDLFLVAADNRLVLLDTDGTERTVLERDMMLHEPRVLAARERPPVIPSAVHSGGTMGTFALSDVYAGRQMQGVERGSIKSLLVLEDLPKPAHFHGGGSMPVGMGVTNTLKRILGEVPVEPDGSAHFRAPAMRSIYFALLDEQGRCVKQMRSFTTLQPGERAGCVGCHEKRTRGPGKKATTPMPAAFLREPDRIVRRTQVPEIMDFPRDVQPVLDKHCVRCHSAEKPSGGVTLTGDRGPVYSRGFYELFLMHQVRDKAGYNTSRPQGEDEPYTTYSSASPLMDKIGGKHHDVQLAEAERDLIRLWIDTSAQYAGTTAAFGTGCIGAAWGKGGYRQMADRWETTAASIQAVEKRCRTCHGATIPRFLTDRKMARGMAGLGSTTRRVHRTSRHRVFNLTHPERSLMLLAPLAKAADGYAEDSSATASQDRIRGVREYDNPPEPIVHPVVFQSTDDPDYQAILAHIRQGKAELERIKRFDMPGFRPRREYLREMVRYGVLPDDFDLHHDPADPYELDERYFQLFYPKPQPE